MVPLYQDTSAWRFFELSLTLFICFDRRLMSKLNEATLRHSALVLSAPNAPQTARPRLKRESAWTNHVADTVADTVADDVADTAEDSTAETHSAKVIHLVRHAQGYHKMDKRPIYERDADARLTFKGEHQCKRLRHALTQREECCESAAHLERASQRAQVGSELPGHLQPQLIVSSPLARTIQTASLVFADQIAAGIPIIAHEAKENSPFCGSLNINTPPKKFPGRGVA